MLGGGMTLDQVANNSNSEPATKVWRPSVALITLAGLMLLLSVAPFLTGLQLMWDGGWIGLNTVMAS